MLDKFKDLGKDADNDIPSFAWISLARRGMEKISLDQCFLKGWDNKDPSQLEKVGVEESDDQQKNIKKVTIKCKKCHGTFKIMLETLKKVAKPTQKEEKEDEILSMGLVYILDENDNSIGHLGYF